MNAAAALVIATALAMPLQVSAQEEPPASALINQGTQETVEAARAASIRSSEETFAYFEGEVDEALARAVERVWDPERPREPSPPSRVATQWLGERTFAGETSARAYTVAGPCRNRTCFPAHAASFAVDEEKDWGGGE